MTTPMPSPPHPNGRLTVDLSAIVANWQKLRGKSAHKQCAAVVKADAYGLGTQPVAKALYKAGCRDFFTATIGEGVMVRKVAPKANVYIFNGFNVKAEAEYRRHILTPVINSPRGITNWTAKARRGQRAALHIDTGMNRLGLGPEELSWLLSSPELLEKLNPELVVSHFACADDPRHPLNGRQIERFGEAARHFPEARKSLANSAGVFVGKKAHFDLLRPGVSLYGGDAVNGVKNPMKPVVRLEGRILQMRTIKKGESVGYGAAAVLKRNSRVATVAIGYADGLHRQASGAGTPLRNNGVGTGGCAMIGRHRAPILGRISMDLTALDVTDIPERTLARTEWVDFINRQLRVDELAASAGTIGYELLTSLGQRYERIYAGS
ncbi:alanine racemase [Salaquimonas pukyongi]|uniref:alanine racemase n=1 Tax=Salaquimonas pukyongi TaxID=2712698 RepID=UPI0009F91119|nr:alanine racemase [Salaquimonas pukyongi]